MPYQNSISDHIPGGKTMPVDISIRNEKKPEYQQERKFNQPLITIGRDESNHVMLEDKRKAVSRRHAEVRLEDGIYFIIDKGSRNGTFINNHRLSPEQPYALEHGSILNIGDYILRVSMQKETPQREDATVFVSNPFLEEIQDLSSLLDKIEEKYLAEDSAIRREYLTQAVQDMMQAHSNDEVTAVVGNSLLNRVQSPEQSSRQFTPESTPNRKNPIDIPADTSALSGEVMNTFIAAFINAQQLMSKFHAEFIGTTRVESDDAFHQKSVDDVKEYLFNTELDYSQIEKRITLFRRKVDEMNIHQIALLDGYRNSIREGVRELLREMNPAIIKNAIKKNNIELGPLKIPVSIIPFYNQMKTLEILQRKHYEFSAEDQGIVEKKHFRPAFSKRYLENMSSRKKDL
jgi:type VI secretion system protein ImpI